MDKITLVSSDDENDDIFDYRDILKTLIKNMESIKPCNIPKVDKTWRDIDFLNAHRANIKKKFEKKAKLTKYGCFITINPDSTINMNNFLAFRNNITQYILTKKWAKSAIVTYEQRTESVVPPWKGFHVHLLICFEDKIRPYKANGIKEITQTLEKKVSYKFNVNYKYLKTIDDYHRCEDYISGNKAQKSKVRKHKADLEFRKFFNIN